MTGLASMLLASALTLSALGQDAVNPPATSTDRAADRTATVDHTTRDDSGFSPGWLGLLGLIGLAGLMPRDRRDRHVHTTGTMPVNR
jgi:MYXO-CTERM domain-containing protein